MTRKVLALIVTLMSSALIWPAPALAFRWRTCNGHAITPGNINYGIDQCGFRNGSTGWRDVVDMLEQWNDVFGMWDRFSHHDDSIACNRISHSNGRSEIFRAAAGELDGALAVTFVRRGACTFFWDRPNIDEADIGVDTAFTFTEGRMGRVISHNAWGDDPSLRTTLLHELGHALGLLHEDRDATIMNTTSAGGHHYYYSEAIQPNPDDSNGGRHLHGSGNRMTNVAAAYTTHVGGGRVRINNPQTTRTVCPGDTLRVDWTLSNNGTENVTYNIGWYLSTNDYITNWFDVLASSGSNGRINAGSNFSSDWMLSIPTSVTAGTEYFIGTFPDHDGRVAEWYETDNRTVEGTKVRIGSEAFCR